MAVLFGRAIRRCAGIIGSEMSQLSLFGAMAREPALADIEGLLAGNGQVVRRDDVARISVVVAEDWRVMCSSMSCESRSI